MILVLGKDELMLSIHSAEGERTYTLVIGFADTTISTQHITITGIWVSRSRNRVSAVSDMWLTVISRRWRLLAPFLIGCETVSQW